MKQPIPSPPGLMQVWQILELLTTPEALKAKLKELEDLRKEVNEQIRKMKIKTDADQMLSSAKMKDQRAQEKLDKATKLAEEALETAKEQAESLVADAKERASKIEADAKSQLEEAARLQSDLSAEKKFVQDKQSELDALLKTAERNAEKSERIRADLEEKQKKINEVLG